MERAVTLAVILAGLAAPVAPREAHADGRDMCQRGTRYRGTPVDLDVKNADIHDVMRLLADVGGVNIVVADTVKGNVTLRLKKVPWDLIACTIASVHKLVLTAEQNVVLVRPRT